MKQFFKFMFASMLGTILTLIIVFFIFMGIIAYLVSFAEKETIKVPEKSIIYMNLDQPISERSPKDPFALFDMASKEFIKQLGLNDILRNIEKATKDDNIKGIYLDLSQIHTGIATVEEIRNALVEFKQSGKFIICYGEGFSQVAYYLATVANEIYLHPDGLIDFKGINADVMFLKETLEKLEIEAQIVRHGKYKSAVEPFMRKDLSEANREQLTEVVNSIWGNFIGKISEARQISVERLNIIADKLDCFDAEKALENRLVDRLLYKDQLLNELRSKLGIGEEDKISKILLRKYSHAPDTEKKKYTKDKIAVIYAVGIIMGGKGTDDVIGSARLSEAIRKARLDDNIKAIVMRVNSPGGDALASDVIWREVTLAREQKPFIVSMGDVAASGGYWISCAADKIIADPNTITGSIGVLALIPNMKNLLNNKLGFTFDNVKSNENAEFPTIVRPITPYQLKVLERTIDKVYQEFLEKVAVGRNMTTGQVHQIAQGRIWTGIDAKEIGLVDDIGGIEDAINMAAEMAELTDYRIRELPVLKDPFMQLFEQLTGQSRVEHYLRNELGVYYTYYDYIKYMSSGHGIQARLPFEFRIY